MSVGIPISTRRREDLRLDSSNSRMMINSSHSNGVSEHHFTPSHHSSTNGRSKMDYSTLNSNNSNKTAPTTGSYVGFANIPNQVFRRSIKLGFEFSLMVVGQSGLGKSTFINSLFLSEVYPSAAMGTVRSFPPTVKIESHPVRMTENGVTLNLTLVDTPGFGDHIDNTKCWEPVVDFVDRKFLDYFTEETKIERKQHISDGRLHLCIYFIAPSGHGLKQMDIEVMKRLHECVNLLPVIAKADTMMPDELIRFKKQISKEITANNIKVYKFPDTEDEDEKREQQKLKDRIPFAVVGSNLVKEGEGGKQIRYRQYPWGTVEVENMEHNDFIALRDLVIRLNMIDLIDVTKNVHYENFRCRQMSRQTKASTDRDPFTQMEKEKHDKERELADKKANMEKVFEEKVTERERKIADKDSKLNQKEKEYKKVLEEKQAELERAKSELMGTKRSNPQLGSLDSRSSIISGNGESMIDGKRKTLGTIMFGR